MKYLHYYEWIHFPFFFFCHYNHMWTSHGMQNTITRWSSVYIASYQSMSKCSSLSDCAGALNQLMQFQSAFARTLLVYFFHKTHVCLYVYIWLYRHIGQFVVYFVLLLLFFRHDTTTCKSFAFSACQQKYCFPAHLPHMHAINI